MLSRNRNLSNIASSILRGDQVNDSQFSAEMFLDFDGIDVLSIFF